MYNNSQQLKFNKIVATDQVISINNKMKVNNNNNKIKVLVEEALLGENKHNAGADRHP